MKLSTTPEKYHNRILRDAILMHLIRFVLLSWSLLFWMVANGPGSCLVMWQLKYQTGDFVGIVNKKLSSC